MNNLMYWLATLYLSHVSTRKFLRWLQSFPNIETLFKASQKKLLAVGLSEKADK